MPLVNVMVNGRAYTIACDEGEEDHLARIGQLCGRQACANCWNPSARSAIRGCC